MNDSEKCQLKEHITEVSQGLMEYLMAERKLRRCIKEYKNELIGGVFPRIEGVIPGSGKVFKGIQCEFLVSHALNSLHEGYGELRRDFFNQASMKHVEALRAIENDDCDVLEKIREYEEFANRICDKKELNEINI